MEDTDNGHVGSAPIPSEKIPSIMPFSLRLEFKIAILQHNFPLAARTQQIHSSLKNLHKKLKTKLCSHDLFCINITRPFRASCKCFSNLTNRAPSSSTCWLSAVPRSSMMEYSYLGKPLIISHSNCHSLSSEITIDFESPTVCPLSQFYWKYLSFPNK